MDKTDSKITYKDANESSSSFSFEDTDEELKDILEKIDIFYHMIPKIIKTRLKDYIEKELFIDNYIGDLL